MKNNERTNHLIIYDQNVDALAFAVDNWSLLYFGVLDGAVGHTAASACRRSPASESGPMGSQQGEKQTLKQLVLRCEVI